ncbi:GDP-L-fucose synthase [Teredinibacter sp. KSP-S5-2]|uniref:GDP-L-fucose synthase n=1 Tax=Teredinibacter sp. KSP-S5-2 TaxID=3034506 RepID=UPI0029342C6B|nr:GDP-L-fucose synthase [Teredinibacter sp. KSP-S5-2]WNO07851.1 GDP-L-fucose synthase [Teredinibacter sp. KSP-S5-2]
MKNKNVFVAGHGGMVGSAIVKRLQGLHGINLVLVSRTDLDLVNQRSVDDFFKKNAIEQVYLAAAKVGGIWANDTMPAQFIYENLQIASNVIHAAYQNNVSKLLFLGSSCIYPKLAPQPMSEDSLLSGKLEPTNEPYAIAKIAGIKLCESYCRQYGCDFRSVMPTNLYGPNDNFDLENSHVIPALLRKFHDAKVNNSESVTIWGSGSPKREFLHVDDMAAACIHVMNLSKEEYSQCTEEKVSHVNVGTGVDCSILELANKISKVVEYTGDIRFDSSKPDGAPRKLLKVDRLKNMGWESNILLDEGLRDTYQWFLSNMDSLRLK